MGQSQILDTHTSLLNVDDICSIKIVKQLITSGIIKKGPKSADRGYCFISPVLYGGEERGCLVTAPSFLFYSDKQKEDICFRNLTLA